MQDRLDIPGKTDDLRARRTRDQLAWAFVALLQEKPYEDISVQDIAERAQVGRSTFYAHFQDKDEMFIRHNVVFGQTMGEQLVWDAASSSYRFPVRFLFEHVQHMRPVYESLAKSRKLDLLLRVWQVNLAEVFEKRIAASRGAEPAPMPAAILAQHLAATILNLLAWSVEHHFPFDAQRMDEHFQRLTEGLR